MKYQVTELLKDTIEYYYIKDKFIYVVYLDGHIVPYDYTEEKEKEIQNTMLKQAHMLVKQFKDSIEFEKECHENVSKYTKIGYVNLIPLGITSFAFHNSVETKDNVFKVTLYASLIVLILIVYFKYHLKAYKYGMKEDYTHDKNEYTIRLATYLSFKDKYERFINDEELQEITKHLQPLNINTFDKYSEEDIIKIHKYIQKKEHEIMDDTCKSFAEYYSDPHTTTGISTYDTIEKSHYKQKTKVLSKVLVSPFKDLDN